MEEFTKLVVYINHQFSELNIFCRPLETSECHLLYGLYKNSNDFFIQTTGHKAKQSDAKDLFMSLPSYKTFQKLA